MKKRCTRCGGFMSLESYNQPCDDCARNGAKSCDACWVHFERKCINCGGTVYLPRRTRKQVREAIVKARRGG